MKRILILLCCGILGVALPIVRASAQSSIPFLDMAVSPNTQNAAPGSSPFWAIQFTNNNDVTAYFTLVGFDDGLGAVPDISVPTYNLVPFGQNYTLAPNASMTLSSLFQTVISPSAALATHDSTAEAIYNLYDSSSFSTPLQQGATADADWTLNVQAAAPPSVPEPGSIALLIGATVTGSVFCLRRLKKRLIHTAR